MIPPPEIYRFDIEAQHARYVERGATEARHDLRQLRILTAGAIGAAVTIVAGMLIVSSFLH